MKNLVSLAKGHDPNAFTELIQSYMKDMYKVALAIVKNEEDAGDAIQDTILTCWEKIDTLRNNKYFKTWLIRILINNCYSIIDSKKNIYSIDEVPDTGVWDSYDIEIREAFSSLKEGYTTVLILYYQQGFKAKEIAEILKIPVSTVQTRLDRGRKQLQKYLSDENRRDNNGKKEFIGC